MSELNRRACLAPILGLLVLLLSSCIWPAFRYGPDRTGFNSGESAVGAANVADLDVIWTADIGPGTVASPAIAKGVLYLTTEGGELQAFSAAGTTGCSGTPTTCEPLWTAFAGLQPGSSPTVNGDVVYAFGNVPDFEGGGIDTFDGQLWAYDAAGSTGCSGSPKVCSPLWTAATDLPGSASPVVANGTLYVGGDGVEAFDPAGSAGCSGTPTVCTPLWGGTPSVARSSPAVANGVAYQVAGGTLEAYDATGATGCSGTPVSCTPTWRATIPSTVDAPIESSPAVTADLLYIGAGDGKVRAFKTAATFPQCTSVVPKNCNPVWTRTTGGSIASSPAVANGVVYVGSDDDKLYALDAATGAVLWTATTGGDVRSSPTVANGVVYVGSDDAHVYAFDAAGTSNCSGTPKVCTPLWSHLTDGAVWSSPVILSGKLYVGSTVGTLYAFGL